jgi:hypothetical protein
MTPEKHLVVVAKSNYLGGAEALYVDGVLVLRRTPITPEDVFEALGISVRFVQFDYWGIANGPFPDSLPDLPMEPK